jgi:tetratricopeptide (TPR) repeat protein
MYYNPAAIPLEHLQPNTSEKGLTLDNDGVIEGGFRGDGDTAFALKEGGPKNGVRTAIEDFLKDHPELHFEVVPAVLGLGVIYSSNAPWAKQLSALFQPYTNAAFLERIERNRLRLHMKVIELEDELRNLKNGVATAKSTRKSDSALKTTVKRPDQAPIFADGFSSEESAALIRQVQTLLAQNQIWSATLVAKRAVEVQPQSTEALKILAEVLYAQETWDEAGFAYEKLAIQFSDDLLIWQRRLECSLKQGHQVLADLILEEALERHPEWQSKLSGGASPVIQNHSEEGTIGGRGFFEPATEGAANF